MDREKGGRVAVIGPVFRVCEEPLQDQGNEVLHRRRVELEAWQDLLRNGHEGRLVIRGKSMMPALRPGWTVGVRPIAAARLRAGDVAVFLSGAEFVAHRIVLSLGWGRRRLLFEQGDALPGSSRLDPRALMGRVERVLDDRGQVVSRERWQWGPGGRMVRPVSLFVRLAVERVLRSLRPGRRAGTGG